MIDGRLEAISDKIRHGISVDVSEACEAIAYQDRDKTLVDRTKLWWRLWR